MSRDKCGAAAAAGLMASIAALQPQGVKVDKDFFCPFYIQVVGALAMVRNSVGANCYVADEQGRGEDQGGQYRRRGKDGDGRRAV